MKIIQTKLDLGLGKEVRFLHASDTHLTRADGRDGARKTALGVKRSRVFPNNEESVLFIEQTVKETGELLVYTGDLIDFVSRANFSRAKQFAETTGCFFVAGNHEFSRYVGEAWEDEAYRNKSLARVQACFPNDIRFASRVLDGVNLVGIDNSYYRFDRAQLAALKREAEKGLPILLFVHDPLHEPAIYDNMMVEKKRECAYLVDTPEELMASYPEYRYRQQKADAITHETVEFIKNEPTIKAIFAGHMHFDFEGMVTDRLPQYVTGLDTIREVLIY
ncbi:MAG: metallophosphoesterase [Ruminococcus sp.]|nr:metallophosphoesterase [Candidatus Apopatosoma intestinale]